MGEIVLQGKRYVGVFEGNRKSGTFSGSGYAGDYDGFWYEGVGRIRNIETNAVHHVRFRTDHWDSTLRDYCGWPSNVEEALVQFPRRGTRALSSTLRSYEFIIDLAMEEMVKQLQNPRQGVLPVVQPPSLDLEYLVKEGLCVLASNTKIT